MTDALTHDQIGEMARRVAIHVHGFTPDTAPAALLGYAASLKAAATVLAQAMRAFGRPEAEVDAFFDFQNHGPNGPDGKPGTADDLKDPILELK